ncbi:pyrroline-5-carboxylate reductase [Propionispira arboris]|uniref:Pyrroline-5-carboxylate reductase n=1 Tax=Propionispira arboris TaxID=84035 RepID=A0A1H6W478_9FIRM|nr:pyrroline-5-carboxylate reductase [Propionispira arboris]SEJ11821.1 pyrroline-5-carboxylate reductase [Propionispira arboris]
MNIGFIGGGAMAEAMIGGILANKLFTPDEVYVSDHKIKRCEQLHTLYGAQAAVNASTFLEKLDIVVLAIKPQAAQAAIESIVKLVNADTIVISVIAGLTLKSLETYFVQQPVVRVMPNTPVAVGAGMSAIALGKNASEQNGKTVESIFNAVGKAVILQESAIDAVTGLSGSGPGYVFVMIDALADAGVNAGLPRQTSIMLAAQTLLGAAKMVLETGEHPAVLRDKVTSPGGTTIAGIHVLEQKGVRAALIDAVEAATNKSKAMGKS